VYFITQKRLKIFKKIKKVPGHLIRGLSPLKNGLKILKNKKMVFKIKKKNPCFFADFDRTESNKNKIQNTSFLEGPN